MKTVYEAANAVEAHMLMDLMQQEGLSPQILGSHLQGAAGELPAGGLVRLVIAEDDYAQARAVIERWEATEVTQTLAPPSSAVNKLGVFLAGLLMGGLVMYAFYHSPATTDVIDHNGDGRSDERWIYAPSGQLHAYEADRNLDGKVDAISQYDARAVVQSAKTDDDFDGVYETHISFDNGNTSAFEVDTNADGLPDVLTLY